jgi:hypothetical protein
LCEVKSPFNAANGLILGNKNIKYLPSVDGKLQLKSGSTGCMEEIQGGMAITGLASVNLLFSLSLTCRLSLVWHSVVTGEFLQFFCCS